MGKLDLVSADPEGGEAVPVETKKSRVPNTPERSYPARDHATPLYVQEQGARVGKTSERLEIHKGEDKLGEAKVRDVSQLVLMGNVQVSAQTIHLLMEKEIPIVHLSTGGWFHGITYGMGIRNAYNRSAQYQAAAVPERCLAFARGGGSSAPMPTAAPSNPGAKRRSSPLGNNAWTNSTPTRSSATAAPGAPPSRSRPACWPAGCAATSPTSHVPSCAEPPPQTLPLHL